MRRLCDFLPSDIIGVIEFRIFRSLSSLRFSTGCPIAALPTGLLYLYLDSNPREKPQLSSKQPVQPSAVTPGPVCIKQFTQDRLGDADILTHNLVLVSRAIPFTLDKFVVHTGPGADCFLLQAESRRVYTIFSLWDQEFSRKFSPKLRPQRAHGDFSAVLALFLFEISRVQNQSWYFKCFFY